VQSLLCCNGRFWPACDAIQLRICDCCSSIICSDVSRISRAGAWLSGSLTVSGSLSHIAFVVYMSA
jgi:hypothetical protein